MQSRRSSVVLVVALAARTAPRPESDAAVDGATADRPRGDGAVDAREPVDVAAGVDTASAEDIAAPPGDAPPLRDATLPSDVVAVDGPATTVAVRWGSTAQPPARSPCCRRSKASACAPGSRATPTRTTARLEYRPAGETAWRAALAPVVDRRPTVGGAANPYVNEARGRVVQLRPDTLYEVRLTWTDADGVGPQPPSGTVRTLSYSPPLPGATRVATNDATLAAALGSASPGDTIVLRPGTYAPFAVTRSGTASAYIAVAGESVDTVVVSGAGAQNVRLAGNDRVVRNLTLGPSDHSGVVVAAGTHHVFVQDNRITDVSRTCAADRTAAYDDAGVQLGADVSDIYVLRNTIASTSLERAACTSPTSRWDSPGTGIYRLGRVGATVVLAGNRITGGFRDGIGGANAHVENMDVADNVVRGAKDDCFEVDGANLNTRVWGNQAINDNGLSGISNAPTTVGPLYVFRNVVISRTTQAGTLIKGRPDGEGFSFYIHNTLDATQTAVHQDGVLDGTRHHVLWNNVIAAGTFCIGRYPSGSVLDHNLYFSRTNQAVYRWNGTTDYPTVVSFNRATGQEANGVEGDPRFVDTEAHINATSPAVDRGLVIPNFNDATSARPFRGAAPDLGAFEP